MFQVLSSTGKKLGGFSIVGLVLLGVKVYAQFSAPRCSSPTHRCKKIGRSQSIGSLHLETRNFCG
jgi:hypothetical protein